MEEILELVPLVIEAKGEVLASNLDEFKASVAAVLGGINQELETDADFGKAEQDIKLLKGAEDAIKAAKDKALSDTNQLNELLEAMEAVKANIASVRKNLDDKVKSRKEAIRNQLVKDQIDLLECVPHLRGVLYAVRLRNSIKGKRTIDSTKEALRKEAALINRSITDSRKAIQAFIAQYGGDLVMDADDLENKGLMFVEPELRRRLDAKKAREEKERLENELEQAKAQNAPVAPSAASFVPPAQPSHMPVVSTQKVTADEEWAKVDEVVKAAFASIARIKGVLIHSENIAAMDTFSGFVNKGWNEAINGRARG